MTDEVGGAAPVPTGIAPSFTWGSSARVISTLANLSQSAQLAQVTLPEPAVCSLYFQTRITRSNNLAATIKVFTLNLLQGIGRVTVPRQISFASQPAISQPIEFTLPFVPLHALQVNVSQVAVGLSTLADELETETYLVLAPLTRVAAATAKDAMRFGMALPGEADSLDDDMRDELEAEAPTVAEIMGREVTGEIEDPEPEPPPPLSPERSIVDQIVNELRIRLGRAPTRAEAQAAVARVQKRIARRGGRVI